jgi:hypothetical protein
MARRKPSGIIDVVKDIVSPWLGTPPGQNRQVTQAQGLARGAAETLDQAFTGGMVKAGVQGNQALVKQAAVNAAALGTGYIAGKAVQTAAGAAGVGAAKVAGKAVANVKAARQVGKLDWDPKPFVEGVRTPDRASFYWKPETDVVNPTNPDISYSVAVRPANPKAARSAPRSTDKGYKVEISRFSANQVNEIFDSAADYNKIVGAKPSSSANAPTSDQLLRSLQSDKVYKDLKKAQRAAERLVKRDIKRR